jgi:hypothetical protein
LQKLVRVSREVLSTSELYMPVGPRPVGLASAALANSFPTSSRALTFRPSSDSRESDSFSRAGVPLRSSFACTPRRSWRLILPGFLSSSRRLPGCPLMRGFPCPRYVPSSGFLILSTVCSTLRIRGPVSSHCHVQDSLPFRGFSCSLAGRARRPSVPPCRSARFAHRQAGCHSLRPRLRGLRPWSNAFLAVGV